MATISANTLRPAERTSISQLPAALRLWHLASLDAPTVAVTWARAFAWTAHVNLAAWPMAVLGLVVWTIYVGDRLLDARRGTHDLRERHHFHWRHRRILAPLAAAAGLAATGIVSQRVSLTALPQDSAVAVAALAYFSGVHSKVKLPAPVSRALAAFGTREFLVGMLFAAGCVLPAWSMSPQGSSPAGFAQIVAVPAIYFSALAWLNVRAITRWESGGAETGMPPGKRTLAGVSYLLAGCGILLADVSTASQPRAAALLAVGTLSALMIGWLDGRRERFSPLTHRVAVDLVLLTPVLLVAAAPLVR